MFKTGLRGIAVVAGVSVLVLSYLFLQSNVQRGKYETPVGDQNAIKLSDGSVMYLNSRSSAEVNFSDHAREIRLIDGEAMFVVERDASRPFRVITDVATIQAVGTEFNVYRRSEGVRVSVVNGVVQISPENGALGTVDEQAHGESARPALPLVTKLAAGEEADVAAGRIIKARAPDLERAVAWRARRLIFRSDTLQEVAEEFNRYNQVRIRIDAGEGAQLRRISGVFNADDPEPLIRFLSNDETISIEHTPQEVIIRTADGPVPAQ